MTDKNEEPNEYILDWLSASAELMVSISKVAGIELDADEDTIRNMPHTKRMMRFPVTCFSKGDDEPVSADENPLEHIMEGTAVAELLTSKGVIEGVEMNFFPNMAPIITCIVQMPMRRDMKLDKDDYDALCQTVLTLFAVHRVRDPFRVFMKKKVLESFQTKRPAAPSDTTIH